jgi:hypothetical protein
MVLLDKRPLQVRAVLNETNCAEWSAVGLISYGAVDRPPRRAAGLRRYVSDWSIEGHQRRCPYRKPKMADRDGDRLTCASMIWFIDQFARPTYRWLP